LSCVVVDDEISIFSIHKESNSDAHSHAVVDYGLVIKFHYLLQ
jgi:hypothetical protein